MLDKARGCEQETSPGNNESTQRKTTIKAINIIYQRKNTDKNSGFKRQKH